MMIRKTMNKDRWQNFSSLLLRSWICAFLFPGFAYAQFPPFTSQFPIDQCHFSVFGGNPYFILNPGHQLIFAGEEDGNTVDLIITVLNKTKEIMLPAGNGSRTITVRIIEEQEIIDGVIAEIAQHYYARCIETSDIYYFGEQVNVYEGGEIVSNIGSWEAGTNGAVPGIIMPGTFMLGARYFHQQAPGAIMDMAENSEMGLTVQTSIGDLENCIRIFEYDGFKPETAPSIKIYAPGIGIINDDDILKLEELHLGKTGLPNVCSFIPFSDHPFLPFSPGMQLEYQGSGNQTDVSMLITVLDEIRNISLEVEGSTKLIQTRVIESRLTDNGELLQVSRDFLAVCIETSDVYIFGRELELSINGELVGTEDSWLAGVNGATPGIAMPGLINEGAQYSQGDAPGIFSSQTTVTATDVTAMVPAGSFIGSVAISETINISTTNKKIFAPGIGLVSINNTLNLSSYSFPNSGNELPLLSIEDSVTLSWPLDDATLKVESSLDMNEWDEVRENASVSDGRNEISLPRDASQNFFRLSEEGSTR